MKRGYITKINSAKEFQEHVLLFEEHGVTLENVVINLDFEEFIASLAEGDIVVIYSYVGLFASLGSYLTTAIELMERGVVIESLVEPGVAINNSNRQFVCELNDLNRRLRSMSSLKGVSKLKSEGKRVGRPRGTSTELQKKVAKVAKLREESNITVVAACKLTKCNMKTYYRLKHKEGAESR